MKRVILPTIAGLVIVVLIALWIGAGLLVTIHLPIVFALVVFVVWVFAPIFLLVNWSDEIENS